MYHDEFPKVYIGKYLNEDIVRDSSSGGAFTALFEYTIQNGYKVWGCSFEKNFKVRHTSSDTEEDCKKFRKSKYILSDISDAYRNIEQDLLANKKVLFTGTPCQCGALLGYLNAKKVNTDQLVLVDLICHGAPNQKIFDAYIEELQTKKQDKIVNYRFKNKQPINGSVNSRSCEITYLSNETEYRTSKNDPFLKGYYSRLFYRPSCGKCPFSTPSRNGDITLGDAWGAEKIYSDLNPLEGASLIIINTKKGEAIFEAFAQKMILKSSSINWAMNNNSQLVTPTQMHKNRSLFFELLPKLGFANAVKKSTYIPLYIKVFSKIKSTIKR